MATVETRTREDWLRDRLSGIGASEAAAALGESPFKTVWDLWLEKTGEVDQPDLSEKLYVRLGQVMERGVGEIYAEQTGREVAFWPQTRMQRWPGCPWLFCTPDAIQETTDGVPAGNGTVSIKTTDERFLKQWESDGIPLHYQIQAQQELACLGLDWGTVVVAFGRRTLRHYDFVRNDRFIGALEKKLTEFWRSVESRTQPPVDWTEGCARALAVLHPEDNGETIDLPDDAVRWDGAIQEANEQIKAAERVKTECENKIKAAIGSNTFGRLFGGGSYSWKLQQRRAYSVEAAEFRVLRRLKK